MGWRSDWLYLLIFQEVEKAWKRATEEGAGRFGPPPTDFLLREMPEADWEHIRCRGDARQQWTYQGGDPEPAPCDGEDADLGKRRGMFYERGLVEFFINADRKRVLFTYTLGPRYGRGWIFEVVGQGAKGMLRYAGPAWFS